MKILYAGDACTVIGPLIMASPFNMEVKGLSHYVLGQPMIDAWTAAGHQVVHMTNERAITDFPRTVEELDSYDVLILSDIEFEVMSLYPFWMPGTPMPTHDRIRSIRDYVRQGGALLMIGGWSSFSGRFGTGGYYDTPIEEALPVTMLKGLDDRMETPAGVQVTVHDLEHPIMRDIPWDKAPAFEGFNKLTPKPDADILATIGDDEVEYPLLVTGRFGQGRSAAFASDCAPHWAAHFQPWEYSGQFWVQLVEWLGAKV